MIDGTTTRKPPYHDDLVFFHVREIDFFQGILISPNNNRWLVDIK